MPVGSVKHSCLFFDMPNLKKSRNRPFFCRVLLPIKAVGRFRRPVLAASRDCLNFRSGLGRNRVVVIAVYLITFSLVIYLN